jgi:hypothetical protein
MSRSAGISGRAKAGAVALLLPWLALSACSSQEDAMAEKLAAAEAAAEKAVAAQKAAEKAAAALTAARPAPAPEPTVMADTPSFENDLGGDDEDQGSGEDGELSRGGEGQTVSPDGVIIPGRGV